MQENKWSFLNLMCLICTFLTLFPLWALGRKFGQFTYSRKMYNMLQKQIGEEHEAALKDEDHENEYQEESDKQKTVRDLRHFIRKGLTGILIEIIILIVSAVVFFMTEDLTGRMGIQDRWTGLMILIAAAALIVDFIWLRYRGIRPEDTENTESNKEKRIRGVTQK